MPASANGCPNAGDILAVVSQSGPTVTFFDAVSHEVIDVLTLPAEPHELCWDPDRDVIYCTTTYKAGYYHDNAGPMSIISVIDAHTRHVIETLDIAPEQGPHALALDRSAGRLYISVEANDDSPGGAVILDTASRKLVGRVNTIARGPHWFVITPDGSLGYATNKEADFVTVVDLHTGDLVEKVAMPGSEGIAMSADGTVVAVAAPYGDLRKPPPDQPGVRLIDTSTQKVKAVLETESIIFPVAISARGHVLAGEAVVNDFGAVYTHGSYDADGSTLGLHAPGRLTAWDIETGERLGTAEVGRCPLTMITSPDGARAYVSAVVDSNVSVVDLNTFETLETLDIAKAGEPGAHGLAYISASAE